MDQRKLLPYISDHCHLVIFSRCFTTKEPGLSPRFFHFPDTTRLINLIYSSLLAKRCLPIYNFCYQNFCLLPDTYIIWYYDAIQLLANNFYQLSGL